MKKALIFLVCILFSVVLQADGKDKQKKDISKKRITITKEYDENGNLIRVDSIEITHDFNNENEDFLLFSKDDSVHKIIINPGYLDEYIGKHMDVFSDVHKHFKDFDFADDLEKIFDEDFMKKLEKDMKKLEKNLEGMEEMLQKMDSLQFRIFENLQWIDEDEKKEKKGKNI